MCGARRRPHRVRPGLHRAGTAARGDRGDGRKARAGHGRRARQQAQRRLHPRRGRCEEGRRWRDAGAHFLIIEERESAREIGLFDSSGNFDALGAERFVEAFGFDALLFEAPNKPSQFALLDHFGAEIQLANVRLEELLRVEIYRRGLHADAFAKPGLRFVDDPDRSG